MSDESTDRDDWLRSAAREHYHPPGEPRREAMWRAVRREREAGGVRDGAEGADIADAGPAETGTMPRWAWRAAALAAMLAVGVVLGRETVGPSTTPSADRAPIEGRRAGGSPATGARPAASGSPGATLHVAAGPASAVSPAMHEATRDVLQRAEVLLTGFRSDVAGPGIDRRTARWSADVLTTTRLLLDSPAARDPSTRELLRDLEIVLAQLAALGDDGAASATEAEIVSRGIEQNDVLTRIRMRDERRLALD